MGVSWKAANRDGRTRRKKGERMDPGTKGSSSKRRERAKMGLDL